jgi:hypothetical protein
MRSVVADRRRIGYGENPFAYSLVAKKRTGATRFCAVPTLSQVLAQRTFVKLQRMKLARVPREPVACA